MVRALWMAAQRCEPGEVYNVGGTQIYSVQELIEIIRNRVSTDCQVEQDPALIRTGARNRIVSDSAGHARLVEAPIPLWLRTGDPAKGRRSALCLIPICP